MSTDEIPEVTAYFEAVNAPAPHIQHMQACLDAQQRYTAWIAKWPNACKKCGATGWLHDPGVYRYADGSGDPPSTDMCDGCLASEPVPMPVQGWAAVSCPRCGKAGIALNDVEDLQPDEAIECSCCGWAGGAGADDHMPVVECYCWEN